VALLIWDIKLFREVDNDGPFRSSSGNKRFSCEVKEILGIGPTRKNVFRYDIVHLRPPWSRTHFQWTDLVVVINVVIGILQDGSDREEPWRVIPVRIDDSCHLDHKGFRPGWSVISDSFRPHLSILYCAHNLVTSQSAHNFIAKTLIVRARKRDHYIGPRFNWSRWHEREEVGRHLTFIPGVEIYVLHQDWLGFGEDLDFPGLTHVGDV
jgi:hypothetical protein